jgi:hypothetical protein
LELTQGPIAAHVKQYNLLILLMNFGPKGIKDLEGYEINKPVKMDFYRHEPKHPSQITSQ